MAEPQQPQPQPQQQQQQPPPPQREQEQAKEAGEDGAAEAGGAGAAEPERSASSAAKAAERAEQNNTMTMRPTEDEVLAIRALLAKLQQQVAAAGDSDDPMVRLDRREVQLLGQLLDRGLIRAPSKLLGVPAAGPAADNRDQVSALQFATLFASVRGDSYWPVNVAVSNLNYTVSVPRSSIGIKTVGSQLFGLLKPFIKVLRGFTSDRQDIAVLRDISVCFKSGTSTLVLGPPGSGITTLFKALSGRLSQDRNHRITSDGVFFSGFTDKEVSVRKFANYVDQVDNHIPVLTVRETVEFVFNTVASRRFDQAQADATNEERAHVKQVLDNFPEFILRNFGLTNCAETIVGDDMRRGVSGGERKRVTTAEMLSSRRPFVLYDQISTGLDSAATFDISRLICGVAKTLRSTPVAALLQPAPEVYNLFDEVLILSEGMIMFHGKREDVLPFFESIGYTCPEDRDIADFVQEVTTTARTKFKSRGDAPPTAEAMAAAWRASPFSQPKREDIEHWTQPKNKVDSKLRQQRFDKSAPSFGNTFLGELKLVLRRQARLTMRESAFIRARIMQAVVMGLIIGTVFLHIDLDFSRQNPTPAIQRYGVVFVVLMQMMLTGMSGVPVVLANRGVFYKQNDAYFLRSVTYVIAETVVLLPVSLVETVIMTSIVFWTAEVIPYDAPDAAQTFLTFVVIVFILNVSYGAFMRFFGVISRSAAIGQVLSGITIAFCILFGGFIITSNNIPAWFIWIYWLVPFSWAFRSAILTVFTSEGWDDEQQDVALSLFNIERSVNGSDQPNLLIWLGVLLLFGYLILNMVLSCIGYSKIRIRGAGRQTAKNNLELEEEEDEDVCEAAEHCLEDRASKSNAGESEVRIPTLRQQSTALLGESTKPVDIAFRDLWYSVPSPSDKREQIDLLKGITGYAQAGTMTALMGSSGAGKTTLMDVIAGRKTGGKIRGDILVNGRPKNDVAFSRIMGYVEQNDIHSPHATVREALMFSAMLRQPEEVPKQDKVNFVEAVLEALELDQLRDFEIGFKSEGGLSTEQAKRLTIGVELATNPSVLFADEPTSGLDARAAAIIMRCIKRVAASGRTVICTIHQPSRDIFQEFDRLLLLRRGGRMVYFGDLGHGSQHLLDYLYAVPGTPQMPNARYNPATYMLEVIGAGTGAAKEGMVDYAHEYDSSKLREINDSRLETIIANNKSDREEVRFANRFATSYPLQQLELMKRWNQIYWRSPTYNLIRILLNIVMALLFGLAFLQAEITDISSVQSFVGVIFMSTTFIGVVNLNITIPVLFSERAAYYRERAANSYAVTPYVIAYTVVEIPYLIVSTLIFMVIFYFLVGLSLDAGLFFQHWFIFCLYVTVQTFLGQMLSALLPSQQVANILGGALTGLMTLFSGFTIAVDDIVTFWQFMSYIDPLRYAFAALAQTQLQCDCVVQPRPDTGLSNAVCATGELSGLCSEVCDTNLMGCSLLMVGPIPMTASQYAVQVWGFDYSTTWAYVGALIGFITGFRLITAFAFAHVNHLKR